MRSWKGIIWVIITIVIFMLILIIIIAIVVIVVIVVFVFHYLYDCCYVVDCFYYCYLYNNFYYSCYLKEKKNTHKETGLIKTPQELFKNRLYTSLAPWSNSRRFSKLFCARFVHCIKSILLFCKQFLGAILCYTFRHVTHVACSLTILKSFCKVLQGYKVCKVTSLVSFKT